MVGPGRRIDAENHGRRQAWQEGQPRSAECWVKEQCEDEDRRHGRDYYRSNRGGKDDIVSQFPDVPV